MAKKDKKEKEGKRKNVAVLVLGDIGRSPRMQYHALSLASLPNTHVDVIGYKESDPHPDLVAKENVSIVPIKPFPSLPRALFLLYAPFKVLFQIFYLFWILLFKITSPDYILVQNPPSIPTLFVVVVVGWVRKTKVVLDWHNLGYTILQLTVRKNHPLIKFAKWFERFFGSQAYKHFCVTEEMKKMLVNEWGFPEGSITVLYDRPPERFFKPISSEKKHRFLSKFSSQEIQTHSGEKIKVLPDSAIVVSSTSWTPDEDFGVLLDAIVAYDEAAKHRKELPPITLMITGKGPQREYYEKKIGQLGMQKVVVYTVWLSAEDYPTLLGAADLGVCLHTSSSKLDLPMKVVDMLGTELPVCAISIDYPALDELLPNGKYGTHFTDSEQLAQQFQQLLLNYPKSQKLLSFRESIQRANRGGWDNNWTQNAKPVFFS